MEIVHGGSGIAGEEGNPAEPFLLKFRPVDDYIGSPVGLVANQINERDVIVVTDDLTISEDVGVSHIVAILIVLIASNVSCAKEEATGDFGHAQVHCLKTDGLIRNIASGKPEAEEENENERKHLNPECIEESRLPVNTLVRDEVLAGEE